MIRHVVMLQWKPEATEEQIRTVQDRLETLPGLIPEIRSYTVARDAGLHDTNHHFVVLGEFDDADAFWVYARHPAHVAVIDEAIKPIVADRSALQFEA